MPQLPRKSREREAILSELEDWQDVESTLQASEEEEDEEATLYEIHILLPNLIEHWDKLLLQESKT